MLIIAQHHISDPQTFWTAAKNVGSMIPPGFKLHSVFPSQDMKSGTCVWEAPAVGELQKFLDDAVGNVSRNVCYEIDVANAVGAPAMMATTAA